MVYRARDLRLGRDVALKFLPPDVQTDAADRLLLEASAAAALEHPNLCTVHEVGETEAGRPYLVMAFYEGETLAVALRRGPLPPGEVARVAAAMARGLAAVHGRGIVHGDIKPGNVMLTAAGEVKLLDFGLARMGEVASTGPGATFGTVAYMSPEQVRGEALDARSDLWSLGVVLYEMLTGVRPFGGGDAGAVLYAILHADPEPVREARPGIPEALARVVQRLLRKEREARYPAAPELLAALEHLAPTTREAAPPPGRGTRTLGAALRRHAVVSAAAGLLVVLAGLAVWPFGPGGERASGGAMTGTPEPSVAVLPLGDPGFDGGGDAALAGGMTEGLIATLARTGGLRVIASASGSSFEGGGLDARAIADSLGVSHVLEGSLARTEGRLRLELKLLDGRDGSIRWSETYDRALEDALWVQEEVARGIARELRVRPAGGARPPRARRRMPAVAAYELYLRGSDQALLRSDSGVRRAVEYFEQAIAADSTYAEPYAGLARMYLVLGRGNPGRPIDDLDALAERAALEALALDDSLAEAHAALGLIRQYVASDFARAEAELERAIALDPTKPLPRQWLAQLYLQTGRAAEALAAARGALDLDPLSPSAHAEVAHALLANRRPDEALSQLHRIATVQPPLLRAAGYTAQAYALKGMWPEAIAAVRPHAEAGFPGALSLYGWVLARGGRRDEADRVRAALLERWRRGESGAFELALVYAGLGDHDRAFAWLDRSVEDGSSMSPTHYPMMPILEDLRSDARFELASARLGLRSR